MVPQEPVSRGKDIPSFAEDPIETNPSLANRVTEQRVERKGQCTDKNCDRIEEPNQIDIEQGCEQQRKEQPVLDPALEEI